MANFPPLGVQSCSEGSSRGLFSHNSIITFPSADRNLCAFGYLLNNDTREGAPWAELVTGSREIVELIVRHYTYLEPVSSDHKDIPRDLFVRITGTPTH